MMDQNKREVVVAATCLSDVFSLLYQYGTLETRPVRDVFGMSYHTWERFKVTVERIEEKECMKVLPTNKGLTVRELIDVLEAIPEEDKDLLVGWSDNYESHAAKRVAKVKTTLDGKWVYLFCLV
jgi:hypothetical protein